MGLVKEKIKPGIGRHDGAAHRRGKTAETLGEKKEVVEEEESATGRRIPTGTTGDVNQWVIRATVPQEGESRPCILHNSKGEWRGRGLACTRERWVFAPWKCLVRELFIRRLWTKIFALKWPRLLSPAPFSLSLVLLSVPLPSLRRKLLGLLSSS